MNTFGAMAFAMMMVSASVVSGCAADSDEPEESSDSTESEIRRGPHGISCDAAAICKAACAGAGGWTGSSSVNKTSTWCYCKDRTYRPAVCRP